MSAIDAIFEAAHGLAAGVQVFGDAPRLLIGLLHPPSMWVDQSLSSGQSRFTIRYLHRVSKETLAFVEAENSVLPSQVQPGAVRIFVSGPGIVRVFDDKNRLLANVVDGQLYRMSPDVVHHLTCVGYVVVGYHAENGLNFPDLASAIAEPATA